MADIKKESDDSQRAHNEFLNDVFQHFLGKDMEELKKEGSPFTFFIYKKSVIKEELESALGIHFGKSHQLLIDYDEEYENILVRIEKKEYGASQDTP